MRLQSFAHMSEMEAREEWVDINFQNPTNFETMRSRLESPPQQDVPMDLSPQEYLDALLPSRSQLLQMIRNNLQL